MIVNREGDTVKISLYQDIESILADALAPIVGDHKQAVDYRLFTGSLWEQWRQELEEILTRKEQVFS